LHLIYNPIFLEHDTGMYPENKKRLSSLTDLPEQEIINGEKYLQLVHTPEYIEQIRQACQKGGYLDEDTIVSPESFRAATYAVGATIMASKCQGFALSRPPGHHAHPDRSSGFCLFNNIAIAVQNLVNEGKKVLIFDFDGHFGDGTCDFFYNSNKVMFWSIHQFPGFPGGGDADEIGEGEGRGYTINVPLPINSGDEIFMDAIETFLPVAKEFAPDVVALSAGFDSHQYDMLTDLRISANSYYKIGKIISANFDNIFASLEGGYNIKVFSDCLCNFMDGINNKELRYNEPETDSMIQVYYEYEGRKSLVTQLLRKYWKSI
jgi:acetoin utilization deacetylase AcuC-like enzyme